MCRVSAFIVSRICLARPMVARCPLHASKRQELTVHLCSAASTISFATPSRTASVPQVHHASPFGCSWNSHLLA